jgi:hypothetical protein
MQDDPDYPARLTEHAKEQSLTDLEQALGDREQLSSDREQLRIDQEQTGVDHGRERSVARGEYGDRAIDDSQARVDREQLTSDVRQETLDHAQQGRDSHQVALDESRATLELPVSEQPDVASRAVIQRDASDRARAARERAEGALVRAQAALVRAQAMEARTDTSAPLGAATEVPASGDS